LDQLQTGFGALRKKNASSFVLNFSFCCHFSLIRHLYPDIGNVKKKKQKEKKNYVESWYALVTANVVETFGCPEFITSLTKIFFCFCVVNIRITNQ